MHHFPKVNDGKFKFTWAIFHSYFICGIVQFLKWTIIMHYHKDPWIWRATTYTYDRKALVFEPNSFYIFLYMFLHISFAPIMAMTNLNTTKPRWIDTCFVGVFPPWNNRPWSLIKSATQCHCHLGMVEKSHQNGDDLAFGVDPILVISSMAKKTQKIQPEVDRECSRSRRPACDGLQLVFWERVKV